MKNREKSKQDLFNEFAKEAMAALIANDPNEDYKGVASAACKYAYALITATEEFSIGFLDDE